MSGAAGGPLLHLAPILPARRGNGLAMRAGMFTQALARLGPVTALVVGDDRGPAGLDPALGDVTLQRVAVVGRFDTRLRLIGGIADPASRAAALRAYGRPARTAMLSAPVLAEIEGRLAGRDWEAVVVSRAQLLPVIERAGWLAAGIPVLVDLDDDDGGLLREQAALLRTAGSAGKAGWLQAEADLLDSMIVESARRVSAFVCASEASAVSLRARLGLSVRGVPNGIELSGAAPGPARGEPRLLFVGNLSYQPNVDGLAWFLAQAWPRLREVLPAAELTIAGSDPVEGIRALLPMDGVTLVANPSDLAPLYGRATCAIVPLRLGSGSRIKILEAGAQGVPVVSTRKGCEGLDLDAGRDLFVSEADPAAFAEACLACLADPAGARRRAASLHALVRERHDRERIIEGIADLVRAVVRG